VQYRNVVEFVARLFMAYNQCPSLSLSLSLSKGVVITMKEKQMMCNTFLDGFPFLKERKGSI